MGEPSREYRVDIDWLRAVAVLAVIGFHFQLTGFRGGFVGVDIFFVISGYLIGGILLRDMSAGTFSFAGFWRRRARRILPALYVMIAGVTVPALVVLLQSERAAFLRSIASVALFVSNFFFWSHTSYFDRSAVGAPLLHTWSLAVEEQFYIGLPLLLWLLVRFTAGRPAVIVGGIVALGVASFAVSVSLITADQTSDAFYFPQSRAWEFLLGTCVALAPDPRWAPRWLVAATKYTGVGMIVAAIFSFRAGTPFPGFNALLPCVGAAIYIAAGPVVAANRALSGMEFIGRISYSLYLWHWPLFVLAELYSVSQQVTLPAKLVLLLVLLLVSWLSYQYVEQPFRHTRRSARAVFAASGAGALALLSISAVSLVGSGALYEDDARLAKLRVFQDYDQSPYAIGRCYVGRWTRDNHRDCFARSHEASVLLWGDSTAAHYLPGMTKLLEGRDVDVMVAARPRCYPTLAGWDRAESCRELGARIGRYVAEEKTSLVIISASWNIYLKELDRAPDMVIADIAATARTIAATGARVIVFGPPLQFRNDLPNILMRAAHREVEVDPADIVLPELFEIDARVRAAVADTGATFVSPLDALCPDGHCQLMATPDVPMIWDYAHLTVEGSELVIDRLAPEIRASLPNAKEARAIP